MKEIIIEALQLLRSFDNGSKRGCKCQVIKPPNFYIDSFILYLSQNDAVIAILAITVYKAPFIRDNTSS
jgi:hypothetical protein